MGDFILGKDYREDVLRRRPSSFFQRCKVGKRGQIVLAADRVADPMASIV